MAAGSAGEFGPELTVQAYPIPARDEIWVRYYADIAGQVTLQLLSTAAYPVRQQLHPVVLGENLIRVAVGDLPRGLYMLSLTQQQQRVTRKVLLAD